MIDVRNAYESEIGKFAGALDPQMRKSTDFPGWLRKPETQDKLKGKQVLMYCTGGVRCERASALLQKTACDYDHPPHPHPQPHPHTPSARVQTQTALASFRASSPAPLRAFFFVPFIGIFAFVASFVASFVDCPTCSHPLPSSAPASRPFPLVCLLSSAGAWPFYVCAPRRCRLVTSKASFNCRVASRST